MKIAIINNKQAARKELIRIATMTGEHELAWSTSSGASAVEFCRTVQPDLILLDPMVRDADGVEVVRKIMSQTPCAILIVTGSIDEQSEIVFSAMGAGAIDAVNTPILNTNQYEQAEKTLLNKIAIINVLTRESKSFPEGFPDLKLKPLNRPAEKNLIAIGSSSGGPEALADLFSKLPQDFQSPIVVVQHVDAAFAPGLAKWLNVKSALPVELLKDGCRPVPGKVLIAATNNHLVLSSNGQLVYRDYPADTSYRPSVDVFFQSLAENWEHAVTAIILTGMGKDGAAGMLQLRKKGAYTIAQDRLSAAVYGMPKAAVEIGAASDVLSIEAIAVTLAAMSNMPISNDLAIL